MNPDLPDGVLNVIPEGKPTRWGCPFLLTSAERKITEGCRDMWQYLQTLNFLAFYEKTTVIPTVDLFDHTWDYLRTQQSVPLSFVPSRHRTRRFAQMIRRKVQENAGFDLPEDFIQQLGQLPWAELLMLLHKMFVIDMLSGVTVDEDTTVIAPMPDVTGFYESITGLVTVQLNRAGDYTWGFMQIRNPIDIAGYSGKFHTLRYYEMDGGYFTEPTSDAETVPASFNLTSQTLSTNSDGLLVLNWILSNGQRYTLTRYAEALALPDETLDGLPTDANGNREENVEVVVLSQRAPLGTADEAYLYAVADTIREYLQVYLGTTLT